MMLPFPLAKVHGMIQEIESGYILAINSDSCDIVRRHAFGHELAHIALGHMHQIERPIAECEREANRRAWEFYRLYRSVYRDLCRGEVSLSI